MTNLKPISIHKFTERVCISSYESNLQKLSALNYYVGYLLKNKFIQINH